MVLGNFYSMLLSKVMTILAKIMQSLAVCQKQTSQLIKISRHSLLEVSRRQSDVDCVLPLKSGRKWTWLVNLCTLRNRVLYLEITFFIFMNITRNLQFLSFQKIYTLLGFVRNVWQYSGTNKLWSFGYTDTVNIWSIPHSPFIIHCTL